MLAVFDLPIFVLRNMYKKACKVQETHGEYKKTERGGGEEDFPLSGT